jgi:hypothetical protein
MADSDHQSEASTIRPTTERTPLLRQQSQQEQANEQPVTPLPKGQIALLSLTRVCEPIAFALLLPFVNEMVLRTGELEVEQVSVLKIDHCEE